MNCTQCGTAFTPDQKFCGNCGQVLKAVTAPDKGKPSKPPQANSPTTNFAERDTITCACGALLTPLVDASTICSSCGQVLKAAAAPNIESAVQKSQPPQVNSSASEPSEKSYNSVASFLSSGNFPPSQEVPEANQERIKTFKFDAPAWTAIAVCFLPILFSWVTLRRGYSLESRLKAFGWMIAWTIIVGRIIVYLIAGDLEFPQPETFSPKMAAPAVASAPVFIKETCYQLSTTIGPSSKLSNLQKEELWKQFEGKAFKWKLRVAEVSSGMFGGYTVQYKCAPNSPSLIQDIQIKYPESKKDSVLHLSKGSDYDVTGILRTQGTLLGMTADDLP
ncbi:MAG: zinc ribbon domain-containing protein [Elusimicrobia bacterium]|nr:zinc ribbon domain-containing protein [Elusimicrobiota bacterium]